MIPILRLVRQICDIDNHHDINVGPDEKGSVEIQTTGSSGGNFIPVTITIPTASAHLFGEALIHCATEVEKEEKEKRNPNA